MASSLSHAVAALGIGAFFYKPDIPKRVWVIGVACSGAALRCPLRREGVVWYKMLCHNLSQSRRERYPTEARKLCNASHTRR